MKFKWIKLIGYGGIWQGILQKEIYIDFTKTNSRIITILGDNGSGKSTLLNALNIFPDDNSMFLSEYAEKSGCIIDGDVEYEFKCEHPIKESVDRVTGQTVIERKTTKAYIKKKGPNGYTELNPNGTVSSYKDIIEAEFKLDPNFLALSALSTEDKGFVQKTPGERKRFFNSIIEQVVVYNNINKILTKRNSINKSMMNSLMNKIESIGDEESVNASLQSLTQRINALNIEKENIIKTIAEKDSTIRLLDPDSSIQNLSSTVQAELEIIDTDMKRLEENLRYFLTQNNLSSLTLEEANKLYSNCKTEVELKKEKISQLEKNFEELMTRSEEESRAIQLKTQRLESMKIDVNHVDLNEAIERYTEIVNRCEKAFQDMKIKKAISVSKDEYVTGLETLKSIKEMIDGFKSFRYTHVIYKAVDFMNSNVNVQVMKMDNETKIEKYKQSLKSLENAYAELVANEKVINSLSMRGKGCKIDSCGFISEALALEKTYPDIKKTIMSVSEDISTTTEEIKRLEEENKELDECLLAIKDLQIILRNIANNKSIISKLPNSELFLNTDTFLSKVVNNDSFDEINEIYQYINHANVFEEYKIAKDSLHQLEIDKKIYDSEDKIVEELNADIAQIQERLKGITDSITSNNNEISKLKEEILNTQSLLEALDTIINILNKIKDLQLKKEDNESKIKTIKNNLDKININLSERNNCELRIQTIESNLKPLIADREKLVYGLQMLAQYNEELQTITESYNKIEVIKRYSSPTKNGIQTLFIKVYMNQTLKLANEILSLFFNGKLLLTNYVITENEFSIPCYSSFSNMQVDDISTCSRSEKTMASLSLSAALMKQSSSKFDILRLDEIDEGLDAANRLMYVEALNEVLDILGIEQCIIISHSSELNIGNVGVIKMRTSSATGVIENNGQIIFSA